MSFHCQCPLWDIQVEQLGPLDTDAITVDSSRAGGKYSVTKTAVGKLRSLTSKQKALVSSWLADQRRGGIEIPEIHTANLPQITTRQPLRFSEKIDRMLHYCESNIEKLGQGIGIDSTDPNNIYANHLMALTECQDAEELWALVMLLEKTGLIENNGGMGYLEIAPTETGWRRIEEMQAAMPDSMQAFVAMWFHSSTSDAYTIGIQPAITDSGYAPLRIDNKQHVNKIDDEIISEIRRSRFLVADFTCEPEKPRGGVYFEAGFAMALGIPVIWTCKESSIADLHFDTRQYNHIAWDEPTDLYNKLKARIGAVIGDGPLRKPMS